MQRYAYVISRLDQTLSVEVLNSIQGDVSCALLIYPCMHGT